MKFKCNLSKLPRKIIALKAYAANKVIFPINELCFQLKLENEEHIKPNVRQKKIPQIRAKISNVKTEKNNREYQ
jgi:hypothetical protein